MKVATIKKAFVSKILTADFHMNSMAKQFLWWLTRMEKKSLSCHMHFMSTTYVATLKKDNNGIALMGFL